MRRGAEPCSIARHDFLLLTTQRGHFEDFNDGRSTGRRAGDAPSPAVSCDEPAEATIEGLRVWSGPQLSISLAVAKAWRP
jgi:hypothetical protein